MTMWVLSAEGTIAWPCQDSNENHYARIETRYWQSYSVYNNREDIKGHF
jgi:hypothetical protein